MRGSTCHQTSGSHSRGIFLPVNLLTTRLALLSQCCPEGSASCPSHTSSIMTISWDPALVGDSDFQVIWPSKRWSCVWRMLSCNLILEVGQPRRFRAIVCPQPLSVQTWVSRSRMIWGVLLQRFMEMGIKGRPQPVSQETVSLSLMLRQWIVTLSAGDVPAGQHGRLGVQKVHKTHVKPKSGLSKPSGGQRMSVVKQARAPPPLRSVDDVDMQFRDLLKSQGKVRRKSVHPAYRYPVTLIHTPGRSGKIFLELFCGHATCASGTVRRLLDSVNFVACETHSLTAAPQGYAAMGLDIRQGVDLTCPRVQSCVCQWIAKGHVMGETCQCCCGPSALDRQDGSQCSILLGCLRSG